MTTLAATPRKQQSASQVLRTLTERGELWSPSPGFVGLRGSAGRLFESIERLTTALTRELAPDSWRTPPSISFQTLARADYFSAFPQWLTSLGHQSEDAKDLERVAEHAEPARVATELVRVVPSALPPAVCYHVYEALADRRLDHPVRVNTQGTCWRHEAAGFQPLARGWAFTMREAVCVGAPTDVEDFRVAATAALQNLADRLGLDAELHAASDPFFSPTPDGRARGKALLQRVRGLKYELQVDLGDRRALALGSVNNHVSFFGEAFDIRLADGAPAHSSCLAFGLERWVLAVMMAHGVDPATWPSNVRATLAEGGR